MSDEETQDDDAPKKRSKKPLLIGLLLALLGGGGGFYAVYSGMILGGEPEMAEEAEMEKEPAKIGELPDVEYVPITPLVVSLGDGATGAHLRFSAQLEVDPKYKGEVEQVLPRVIDVLNGYLRAVEMRDLSDNTALMRLRAQMLRRVQIVTGGERVKDLLIMEFVLN